MFRTAKHILSAAVVIGLTALPSAALADTPSGSAPAISQITVTKSVDPPTPRLIQTSVTGKYVAPGQ
jgi:hypothetical protein